MSWYHQYSEAQVGQAIANALAGTPGSSFIHQANVTLTNAQIIATDAYELVAAQGATKIVRLVLGFANKNFAIGYGNFGDVGMYFAYDTPNNYDLASIVMSDSQTEAWLAGAGVVQATFPPYVSVATTATVVRSSGDLADTNLAFSIDNSLGDFSGGDPANTMMVSALYTIFDTVTGEFE